MQSTRIYVNVSYAQKDEAKTKGAKWEPQYKKWYFITKHNIDEKATEHMGYEIYRIPKPKETVEVKKVEEVRKVEEVKKVENIKIVICFCSTVLPFNQKIVYPAVLTSSLVRCLVCILSEVEVSG